MDYSPYAPPQQPNYSAYGGGYQQQYLYKPLGWRTTVTNVGLVATVLLGLLQTGASVAFPNALKNPAPENLGIVLVLGLLGLIVGGVSIATWVLFLVWTNLAAKNVRAFGQQGLEYTPGWCIAWWFIPVASLWKPFQAIREIWKASDPDTVGSAASKPWMEAGVPGTLLAWWLVYISNGFVAMGVTLANLDLSGGKVTVTPGPANFVSHGLLGVAAVFLIIIMRQLAQRQEAAWTRLQSAPAIPRVDGYAHAHGQPGAYGAQRSTSNNPYL